MLAHSRSHTLWIQTLTRAHSFSLSISHTYTAADGRQYYHHAANNTTQWKKPKLSTAVSRIRPAAAIAVDGKQIAGEAAGGDGAVPKDLVEAETEAEYVPL